jgi:NTE family protein
MKSFALALGAGGARGLAHIAVFEALDELGLRPTAIAGSSIGAIAGAAYAAGMTGRALRHHVLSLAHNPAEVWHRPDLLPVLREFLGDAARPREAHRAVPARRDPR